MINRNVTMDYIKGFNMKNGFQFGLIRVTGCLAILASAFASFGLSQRYPALSMEQMTKEADEIILGEVVAQETRVVKHGFETDVKVHVAESLKSRSGEMGPGKDVTITLPGGSIQEPPMTQYVMGQPSFYKGQGVALFLKAAPAQSGPKDARYVDPKSTFGSSYKIVGMNQGSFGVVTRKSDGKKLISRVNLENYGVVNSPSGVKEIENAIAESTLPTVSQNVARTKDIAGEARAKDPLEMTGQDQNALSVEDKAQQAELNKSMRAGKKLPVQDLENFKSQISGYTGSGN